MTPERWQAVKSVLQAALARPASERPAFVAAASEGDAALRAEVESLLAGPDTGELSHEFLDFPIGAAGVAAAAVAAAAGGDSDATAADAFAAGLAGRYAVGRELGHGGMATVYLARDLRHRRPVAVKVLHAELSAALGPERFLCEIETTAALQHPHILPLFDSGEAAGRLYYVMPYVEGETLRARLARERQLPVAEAVRLAREVADALEYAHRRGVVHRDVKPENILLQGGDAPHALVADFGIALAVEQAGRARMTRTGLSVGTPQYMAPEQAMGDRTVGARADVYALGAVLYEMLAGEPPFTGPSAQAVLTRAMTERPRAPAAARPSIPPHVEAAVLTALAKLPADRFGSAAAFAAALADPASGQSDVPFDGRAASPGGARARRASPRAMASLVGGALGVAALGWAVGRTGGRGSAGDAGAVAERGPVRFTIEPDSAVLRFGAPAMSPDGRTVVYAVEGPDGARLYARPLGELAARPLAGTEGGDFPFFSPDGAWVGFASNGAIRRVRLDGGAAVVVTRVPLPEQFAGGSWGRDDVILYATTSRGALRRVPAAGGTPSRVPVADTSLAVLHPHLLPGGRTALVTATRDFTAGWVSAVDLATGRVRAFVPGAGARYAAGEIVYVGIGGELYRQPFDLRRLQPVGAATQIGSGLDALTVTLSVGASSFDASPGGALVYRVGTAPSGEGTLRLVLSDRVGRELQVIPARVPWAPRFSPDGGRLAYGAFAPGRDSSDVWITDLGTGATQRLTTDARDNNDPQWSPDGRAVAYSADAAGGKDVVVQPLDGGPARRFTRPGTQWTSDWAPDGRTLLVTDVPPRRDRDHSGRDVWAQPLDGGAARPYLATPAHEFGARVSPDGRWVAYTSDETGRDEVYVQSHPIPGRKTLISVAGGVNPVWRADSRELYYWHIDQLIAARVAAAGGRTLTVRDRTLLFRAPYFANVHAMYDVAPDGLRFVLVTGGARAGRLVVAVGVLGAGRSAARDYP